MPADPDDSYVWFIENGTNKIAKISPFGKIFEYSLPTAGANAQSITMMDYGGPTLCCLAHDYWYVEPGVNKIGVADPLYPPSDYAVPTANAGLRAIAASYQLAVFTEYNSNQIGEAQYVPPQITEYTLPTPNSGPSAIAYDYSLGGYYIVESLANKIAYFNPSAFTISEYAIPTASAGVSAIASFPVTSKSIAYFAEKTANKIGSVTSSGSFNEYAIPTPNTGVNAIYVDYSGNVWFTEPNVNRIGKMTPSGTFSEYKVPTANAGLAGISQGNEGTESRDGELCCSDSRIWFTEQNANKIGVLSP